jgi:hypothetical protein
MTAPGARVPRGLAGEGPQVALAELRVDEALVLRPDLGP